MFICFFYAIITHGSPASPFLVMGLLFSAITVYKWPDLEDDEVEAATIVFPAISTGIYGYPAGLAAAIAVDAVRAATTRVDEIIFICFDEATLSIYRDLLA